MFPVFRRPAGPRHRTFSLEQVDDLAAKALPTPGFPAGGRAFFRGDFFYLSGPGFDRLSGHAIERVRNESSPRISITRHAIEARAICSLSWLES